jgi:hypothetical protein
VIGSPTERWHDPARSYQSQCALVWRSQLAVHELREAVLPLSWLAGPLQRTARADKYHSTGRGPVIIRVMRTQAECLRGSYRRP